MAGAVRAGNRGAQLFVEAEDELAWSEVQQRGTVGTQARIEDHSVRELIRTQPQLLGDVGDSDPRRRTDRRVSTLLAHRDQRG